MNQDTRKDPRAKVLTMTVRYKSATLDEFIEHHSYDVSRGGMFIKTPSPFPPGTLLKFEVKIADEQRLMQGVGRVVWKREANDSNDSRPAGMGVKFIKIDDESRRTIERLVDARGGDGDNAFDQGNAPRAPMASAPSAAATSAIPSSTAPTKPLEQPPAATGRSRKATVIGLGAMKPSGTSGSSRAVNISSGPPRAVTPSPPQTSEKPAETFFPKTDSRADLPPVEDQTMMKQAKELLADAMRYAGGTAEDVKAAAKVSSIPPHVPRPEPHKSVPPRPTAKEVPKTRAPFADQGEEGEAATTIWRANEAAALLAESMKDSEPPPGQEIHGRITARPPAEASEPEPRFRDSEPATTPGTSTEEERASAGKVAAAPVTAEPAPKLEPEHVEAEAPESEPPKPSVKAPAAKAAVSVSERPSSRARAAMTEAAHESASEGGGGKGVFALLALAAAAGIGFYLTRPPAAAPEPPPEPAPVEAAKPAPIPEPTPVATPPEAPPSAAASAAPADSASAEAAPSAAPEPSASAAPEKPEPAVAEKAAEKPAPRRVVPRRAPAPKKKAEPELSGEESEAPPAEAAPKPPADAAPEAPPPAPPAPPPPSPTPPPATSPLGDNPY